jgi:ferrous iron transport protein B
MKEKCVIRVALAGNPNTGKTTVFNALTGARQKTGNYAGVTVEKREGKRSYGGVEFTICDLPGTYSLTAYSLDEVIARDFILEEKPDVIIDVLDATNIERNLYLFLQLQELGIPMVGALNIVDQAEAMGIKIDSRKLSTLLGVPLTRTVGTKGIGTDELLDAVIAASQKLIPPDRHIFYGSELESEIEQLTREISTDREFSAKYAPRWLAIKLLEKDANAQEKLIGCRNRELIEKKASASIRAIETHFGRDAEIVVSEQRYAYVHGIIAESVMRSSGNFSATSEWIDRILMNRILGLPLFLLTMWCIFQVTFKFGRYATNLLNIAFAFVTTLVSAAIPAGIIHSLLIDGIIGGLSGVLSFVPQIAILFLCISFLEDTGYMARAAFIMDKFLHLFGLHGQSFMPLMLGFGCSVPAIMASRTLKNPRDRIITILVTPFMTCGAKLVVLVFLAGIFFGKNEGTYVMIIYLIGVVLAFLSSLLLSKTVLRGELTPFVMELPPYRLPTARGIAWHVVDKTGRYLKKAGTVLLAASILIWAMVSFPKLPYEAAGINGHSRTQDELAYSVAGRLGKAIEPFVKPLGFDWKIGISAVTGFAAKEAVVSTLGVLYKVGSEEDQKTTSLKAALLADKTFNPLVAFVLMLFTLIVPPCIAALSIIRAEIGWKWLGFAVIYMLSLAWVLCFATYQVGRLAGWGI